MRIFKKVNLQTGLKTNEFRILAETICKVGGSYLKRMNKTRKEAEMQDISNPKKEETQEEKAFSLCKRLLDIWKCYDPWYIEDIDFEAMNRIGYETTKKYFIENEFSLNKSIFEYSLFCQSPIFHRTTVYSISKNIHKTIFV